MTKLPDPNRILVDRLHDDGFQVRCLWEVKAPAHGVAWLTCYQVASSPTRTAFGVFIVQTFAGDNGWEAWLPAHDGVGIEPTIQAVIGRITKKAA